MKNFITIILFIFVAPNIYAQFEFEPKYVDDFYNGTFDFKLHDLDMDGDLDIISHTPTDFRRERKMVFYENNLGEFNLKYFDFTLPRSVGFPYFHSYFDNNNSVNFYSKTGDQLILHSQADTGFLTSVLYEEIESPTSKNAFALGDFNGDDLTDFLVFKSPNLNLIQYNQTTSGDYQEFEYPINLNGIRNELLELPYHEVIDINNDGFDDVVFAGYDLASSTTKFFLFKSNGVSFDEVLLSENVSGALFSVNYRPIQFKDQNNDGLLDFVIIEETGFNQYQPTLFTQNDAGLFDTTALSIDFQNNYHKVFMQDHDLDGDSDLLYLVTGGSHSTINLVENIAGVFQPSQYLTGYFNTQVNQLEAVNLNTDNNLELLSANDGILSYSAFQSGYIGNEVTNKIIGVGRVKSADIDNDGDHDFLIADSFLSTFIFYEDKGSEIETGQVFKFENYVQDFEFIDFNGDEFSDLMYILRLPLNGNSGKYEILRYLNDGQNNFSLFKSEVINAPLYYADTTTADIDNDGDLDLLLVNESSASWYQNNGGVFSTEKSIINRGTGQNEETFALADFDDDGDLDLILAGRVCFVFSCSGEETRWFEFDSNTSDFQSKALLIDGMALKLDTADLNGDGVPELMFSYDGESGVYDFTRSDTTPFNINISLSTHNYFLDINQDGMLDFIYPQFGEVTNYWLNNGNFEFEVMPFSLRSVQGSPHHFDDFNGDGEIDMVVSRSEVGGIAVQYQTNRGNLLIEPVPIKSWASLFMILFVLVITYLFRSLYFGHYSSTSE